MRTRTLTTRMTVVTMLLVLTGCFKLSRESPRLRQYVLSGAPQTGPDGNATSGNQSAAVSSGLAIGVRRMDIASYLVVVPAIVIRRGENEIITSEFHRWGEDLGEGINRVVAANLRVLPPVRAVDVAPWPAGSQHNYLVQLHVSRFEGVADSTASEGRIHVIAGWDIIRPLDGTVLVRGSVDDRGGTFRVGDYAGLVKQLDASLARLARAISTCLSRFPNDSTPPTNCAAGAGVP